jgi:hypothetical protein
MAEQVKLTVHQSSAVPKTPTEQILQKAQEEFVVTDSKGRRITLKKPGVLAQYRLIEALGGSASNETLVAMTMPIIYVAAIDGDPVYMPAKRSDVDATITILGDEGLEAVMLGLKKHFPPSDPEADKAALKK